MGDVLNLPPTIDPSATSGTCDWGDCNRVTEAWRWSYKLYAWLPVCDIHGGSRSSRYPEGSDG